MHANQCEILASAVSRAKCLSRTRVIVVIMFPKVGCQMAKAGGCFSACVSSEHCSIRDYSMTENLREILRRIARRNNRDVRYVDKGRESDEILNDSDNVLDSTTPALIHTIWLQQFKASPSTSRLPGRHGQDQQPLPLALQFRVPDNPLRQHH